MFTPRTNHFAHSAAMRRAFTRLSPLGGLLAFTSAASAQITVFSIDWHSPTVAAPNSFTGSPITEADILAPSTLVPTLGFQPQPGILETGGLLAPVGLNIPLYPGCVGHPAGTPCGIEVDAISHGMDAIVRQGTAGTTANVHYAFSVTRRALGNPGSPLPPAVWTEAPCQDEDADVFTDLGLPAGPIPPLGPGFGNTGIIDGNGMASCSGFAYPGLGLRENPPGTVPGDNLDALDMDVPDRFFPRSTTTYFSLDSAFVDPMTGIANSGSAAANGFRGGMVLKTTTAGVVSVYAAPNQLGLDLIGGVDSDDLDALALWENGINGYQRSSAPYDWTSGATDMLLFSVRRGSAIIGQPDAFFGLPIEPGDILTPTGPLGSLPGIWVAAEDLGLATARSTTTGLPGDDLDGLDTMHPPQPGLQFCAGDGSGTACPCGNTGATGRGCGNSQNSLGAIMWATGSPSIANDTILLNASGMGNLAPCMFLQGTVSLGAGVVFGDGLRCVGGNVVRLGQRVALSGNRSFGYGIPGDPAVHIAGLIGGPGTYYYQTWYRDAAVFCTANTFNLTNGYKIIWTP
jgi:hypothetical protein